MNVKRHCPRLSRCVVALSLIVTTIVVAVIPRTNVAHATVSFYLPYATGYTATMTQGPLACSPDHCAGGTGALAYSYDFLLGGGEVWASAPGEVIHAESHASEGNRVMIRHADNTCTRYIHLASLSVTQGAQVAQGQKLGMEGNTGSSSGGRHLHFERDNCGGNNSMQITFVENSWTSANPGPTLPFSLASPSSGPSAASLRGTTRDIFTGTPSGKLFWTVFTSSYSTSQIGSAEVGASITEVTSAVWSDHRIGVYFGTNTGKVYEVWYQPGGGWTQNLIADVGSGLTITSITAQLVDTPSYEQVNVFFGTSNGKLYEAWWQSGTTWHLVNVLTGLSGSADGIGFLRRGEIMDVFVGTSSGDIYEAWYQPYYGWGSKIVASFGSPITAVTAMMYDTAMTLYVGTSSGAVYETWWYPWMTTWGTTQPASFGSPITSLSGTTNSWGKVDLYAGTASGVIYNAWWSAGTGIWQTGTIANFGASIQGLSSILLPGDVQVIYGVTSTNQVKEAWYTSYPWQSGPVATVT